MDIGLIIPCGSRGDLEACLESIAAQEGAPFDVVLVDDANLGLEDLADLWRSRIPLLQVVQTAGRQGVSHARNLGAQATRADGLLFVDSDDTLGPGYVQQLARALEASPLVCARIDVTELNDPELVDVAYGHPQEDGAMIGELRFLPFAGGGSYGIRRELFERLGGFTENRTIYEDADIAWRAQLFEGAPPPTFVSEAVLHYRFRVRLGERFRQSYRYGRHAVSLYRLYAPYGMPRRRPVPAAVSNAKGLVRAVLMFGSARGRATAASIVGDIVGRTCGSIVERVTYL